jgi:hypothetical protein
MDMHLILTCLTPLARNALHSIRADQARGVIRSDMALTAMSAGMSVMQFHKATRELQELCILRIEPLGTTAAGTAKVRFHLTADPSAILIMLRRPILSQIED